MQDSNSLCWLIEGFYTRRDKVLPSYFQVLLSDLQFMDDEHFFFFKFVGVQANLRAHILNSRDNRLTLLH